MVSDRPIIIKDSLMNNRSILRVTKVFCYMVAVISTLALQRWLPKFDSCQGHIFYLQSDWQITYLASSQKTILLSTFMCMTEVRMLDSKLLQGKWGK